MKNTTFPVLALILFTVAEVTKADFVFGEPTKLGPEVNRSSVGDVTPSFSADGLSLYFASNRPGGHGSGDLYVSRRATKDDSWGPAVNLGSSVNTSAFEACPTISSDELTLFFSDGMDGFSYPLRSGGYGNGDLWVATRAARDDEWGTPVNVGQTVNSGSWELFPYVSSDGLCLYFSSDRGGSTDIWMTTRATIDDNWGTPVNLGPPISIPNSGDNGIAISLDGRALFFSSGRGGSVDIWMTMRASTSSPWGPPMNLGPDVNIGSYNWAPAISSDGFKLCFTSNGAGVGTSGYDLWQAPVISLVDLNGDSVVDARDMCIMVDHWGEEYSLCDIGPTPFGDGIVDVEDLKVLAGHLFEEVSDSTLIAHWPLDEVQGVTAYSNVSDSDATLVNGPTWQPGGGQVGGAIQFDGADDYLRTSFMLNPASTVFSVIAWAKGGAPGQVILSQDHGVNWLMADAVDGALRTDLKRPPETNRATSPAGPPLISSAVVTDGNWHRVGFIRDGIDRILYVDGVEVARDAAENLESAKGGLYIGAGSDLEQGTFFSGLIDDVRIYNRVVSP